jgi:hypothetical protein
MTASSAPGPATKRASAGAHVPDTDFPTRMREIKIYIVVI